MFSLIKVRSMVLKTILASDNDSLTVSNNSPFLDPGDSIINNSSMPNGTIFDFNPGLSQIITINDTLNTEVFDDDEEQDHVIVDGGTLVPVGTEVESESLIVLRALDANGNPTGPEITINVYSRDGETSNIWGYSSTDALEAGKQYVKVDGSNNGDSSYDELVPCFTRGTRILCDRGYLPVEEISVGTLVWTLHGGFKPVTWAGVATVPGTGDFAPIQFDPGVVDNGSELRVSPNHRMYVKSIETELMFGPEPVLVAAQFFLGKPGVRRVEIPIIEYFHFMFERHEIVNAEGSLSESFFPGAVAAQGKNARVREELLRIFPELKDISHIHIQPAARVLRKFEARTLFAA